MLPAQPLAKAERIELGEEVSLNYVKNVLAIGIEQWNWAVKWIMEKSSDPAYILKELELQGANMEELSEQSLEEAVEQIHQKAVGCLFEISLKPTDTAYKTLGIFDQKFTCS